MQNQDKHLKIKFTHPSVLADDQSKGFVEPAVVPFAVQKRLTETIQLCVVRLLHKILKKGNKMRHQRTCNHHHHRTGS